MSISFTVGLQVLRERPWQATRTGPVTAPLLARAVPTDWAGLPPSTTLVTYVFAPSDAAAAGNLRFFVDHALYGGALGADLVAPAKASATRGGRAVPGTRRPARAALAAPAAGKSGRGSGAAFVYDDGADYVFIFQGGDGALSKLPAAAAAIARAALARAGAHPRATVVHRPNTCYDWGAWGWALRPASHGGGGFVHRRHRFFLLVNSSVRGPFVPPSAHAAATAAARAVTGDDNAPRAVVPWHALLTALLGGPGDVRLAGPVISCEAAHRTNRSGWVFSPHVTSWAVATDRIGLAIWQQAGPGKGPLACHADRWAAIERGEVGGSASILAAGHGLACLLPRYAGVDWRGAALAGQVAAIDGPPPANGSLPPGPGPAAAWCNQRVPPLGDGLFDGTTLPPTETLFVKHKGNGSSIGEPMSAAWAGAKAAEWADQMVRGAAEEADGDLTSSGPATADVASKSGPAGHHTKPWQEALPSGVNRHGLRVPWVR